MVKKMLSNKKEYLVIFIGLILGVILCVVCDAYANKASLDRPIIHLIETITRRERGWGVVANVVLFFTGKNFVDIMLKQEKRWVKLALAYPVGIFAWICTSIICLLVGIPYNVYVLGTIFALGNIGLIISLQDSFDIEALIRECGLFLVLTIILSSGLAKNIVGNDTTFYNENYGYWLVEEGRLGGNLLVPMTATGLATPALCSYFKMWNVDNIYLAQNIFRCVFVLFFYKAINMVCESKKKKVLAIIGTLLLVSSPAYSLVSSWIISNSFMMFEMFILAVFLNNLARGRKEYLWLTVMVTFVISFTRVEGAMIALFIIVCALVLNVPKKYINIIILPSIVGQMVYQLICLKFMKDVPNELFVSKQSVIILIAFMVVVFVLVQVLDMKWASLIKNKLGYIIIAVGILGSVGLCLLDYEKYAYNLKIVLTNITYLGKTGSWGMMPLLFVICVLLVIRNLNFEQYWDTMWIAYFVLILAICWSRESVLRVSIADSGNRILIQMVPIFIMTLMVHGDKMLCRTDKEVKHAE